MAEPGHTGANPFINWQQKMDQAGAIVERSWQRYRAAVFQGYLIGAIVVFLVLALLAHTVAYFTFDVTMTREV